MKTTSELIQQAHEQDMAERPTVFKRADELQIGDTILPSRFRRDPLRYVSFVFDETGEPVTADEYEVERMTITGIRFHRDSDGYVSLTLWAELTWVGEPNEDGSGYFMYRRNCTAFPPKGFHYEVFRR